MKGKLSPAQILGLVDLYSELDLEYRELRTFLEARPDTLRKLERSLFGWGAHYEMPFRDQAAMRIA